jgi:hypothetical protein
MTPYRLHCEVAGGFRLDEHRYPIGRRLLRLNDDIHRDVDPMRFAGYHHHPKGVRARRHIAQAFAGRVRLLLVSLLLQVVANQRQLALLLGVANNRIGDRTTEPVGNNGRGAVSFFHARGPFSLQPRENVNVKHLLDGAANALEILVEGGGRHPDCDSPAFHGQNETLVCAG